MGDRPPQKTKKKPSLTTEDASAGLSQDEKEIAASLSLTPQQAATMKINYKTLLEALDETLQELASGSLGKERNNQLMEIVAALHKINDTIEATLQKSTRMGLTKRAPFPALLAQLRRKQNRLEKQIRNIHLYFDEANQNIVTSAAYRTYKIN